MERKPISKGAALTGVIVLAAIIGLVVWRPISGSATPHYSFPVPSRVQRAIAHGYRQLAYLPTRLPHGFRYTSYDGVRGFDFNVWFSSRRGQTVALEYGVVAAECVTQGSTHSFTVNGLRISWSGTYTDQRAWRCITYGRTTLTVSASRSVEGDANPLAGNGLTPKQRRDALQLAQVVAYAEPVR